MWPEYFYKIIVEITCNVSIEKPSSINIEIIICVIVNFSDKIIDIEMAAKFIIILE